MKVRGKDLSLGPVSPATRMCHPTSMALVNGRHLKLFSRKVLSDSNVELDTGLSVESYDVTLRCVRDSIGKFETFSFFSSRF